MFHLSLLRNTYQFATLVGYCITVYIAYGVRATYAEPSHMVAGTPAPLSKRLPRHLSLSRGTYL